LSTRPGEKKGKKKKMFLLVLLSLGEAAIFIRTMTFRGDSQMNFHFGRVNLNTGEMEEKTLLFSFIGDGADGSINGVSAFDPSRKTFFYSNQEANNYIHAVHTTPPQIMSSMAFGIPSNGLNEIYFSEKQKALLISVNLGSIRNVTDEMWIWPTDPHYAGGPEVVHLPQSVDSSGIGYLDQKTDLLYLLGQGVDGTISIFDCANKTIVQQTNFSCGGVLNGIWVDAEIGAFAIVSNQLVKLNFASGECTPYGSPKLQVIIVSTFDSRTGDL
jgi:hypothetical protein